MRMGRCHTCELLRVIKLVWPETEAAIRLAIKDIHKRALLARNGRAPRGGRKSL